MVLYNNAKIRISERINKVYFDLFSASESIFCDAVTKDTNKERKYKVLCIAFPFGAKEYLVFFLLYGSYGGYFDLYNANYAVILRFASSDFTLDF